MPPACALQGSALSTAELKKALAAIMLLRAELPALEKLARSELLVREQANAAAAQAA